jgi:gliding motility-associated protein GldL
MSNFLHSRKFNVIKNFLFGTGAAVVLIGALTKLLHLPIANIMLTVGLSVEAGIFFLSAFIPPEDHYYWEKLYPGLNEYEGKVDPIAGSGAKKSITGELDNMLEKAKIDQSLIDRLGESMKGLGTNISKLANVADTSGSINEFSGAAKSAADALNGVKTSFTQAADAMGKLGSASDAAGKYHEQVQIVTKNLAALNAVYEIELQDTNTHLKTMNKFYTSLTSAMGQLEGSVEDTTKYRENMSKLAVNIEKLNAVYGNMLSAMRS